MYDVGPALLGKLAAAGIHLPEGSVSVGSFGDSPELSEELLALIRIGRKRGGASLLWAWEADGETLPCMGHREVVLDHRGEPVFVTRVTEVQVVPFDRVGADFAAREGEGEAHWPTGAARTGPSSHANASVSPANPHRTCRSCVSRSRWSTCSPGDGAEPGGLVLVRRYPPRRSPP